MFAEGQPTVVSTGSGGGWGGDCGGGWLGMIVILALLGGRGFGFGGGRENEVDVDTRFNALQQQIDANTQFGFQLNTVEKINDVEHASDMNFCATNRNVDSVKLDVERMGWALTRSQDAWGQRILDRIAGDELRETYAKLNEAERRESEQRIIAAMKPVQPIPAYIQPSPYATYDTIQNGFATGLGWGAYRG